MDDREFRDQVRALDGSAVLNRLFEILDSNYVARWRNAQTVEDREEAHLMVKAATDLKAEITYIANDVKISAFNRRLSNGTK